MSTGRVSHITHFSKDKQIRSTYEELDGDLHGVETTYDYFGRVDCIVSWKHGKKTGYIVSFENDGSIAELYHKTNSSYDRLYFFNSRSYEGYSLLYGVCDSLNHGIYIVNQNDILHAQLHVDDRVILDADCEYDLRNLTPEDTLQLVLQYGIESKYLR